MMFQAPSVTRPSSAEITPTAEVAATLARAANPASPNAHTKRAIAEALGQRPLGFEKNQGQFDGATRFAARGANYGIYLDDADVTLAFRRKDNDSTAALRMSVVGANRASSKLVASASDELPGVIRHYRGAEAKPESLAVETRSYARVTRTNVLDGIDLVYYGNQRRLEYDFVVAPGKDPRAIRVQFDGAKQVEVEAETGDLLLHVAGGDPVRQHKPVTYQVIDGTRREVESRYVIDANAQVGFEVGAYDATAPLVIDPVLTYSTYFGNGSEELISDIALDAAGNIYVTGLTTDSAAFPVVNAQWPTKPGKVDAFVTKFNPAGSAILYSTFLGGAENENNTEHYGRIAADAAGNAYIVGNTLSADFPTTANADDPTFVGDAPAGNGDAFYTKLSPGGALAYSTFIGGSRNEYATGVGLDAAGNVYVSGFTVSSEVEGFPVTANGYDTSYNNNGDLFLVKYDVNGVRTYGTYIGGSNPENNQQAYGGLAVSPAGIAYITGDTWSTNYPVLNAAQPTFGGQYDAVLTAIDTTKANGAGLVYSTYFGGPNMENGYGIALGANGIVAIAGEALDEMPLKNARFATFGGDRDAYVAKFDTTQSGAASLLWSTYFPGQWRERFNDVAIDGAGDVHLVGQTTSDNFPNVAAIRTVRYQTSPVAVKLSGDGQTVIYSTFLGANTNKNALNAVVVNADNEAYFAGWTWAEGTNPPNEWGHLIRNPFQATYGGGDADGWIMKIGFAADTLITMSAQPEPVLPNYNVTYTITVTNSSTDPAANLVVTNTLPAAVTFVSCTATNGGVCGGSAATPTITFPGLAGNGQATITIVAKVNLIGPGVSFTNTATLTSTTPDFNTANNTANAVSHTPVINGDPTGDADGDEIPNGWEQEFGLDPLDGTPDGPGGRNGDPDGDGKTNYEEYQQGTHPRGFVITYLAEGATGAFFDTRLAIANPGDKEALVLCRFQSSTGAVERYYQKVAPHSRATIDVEGLPNMGSVSFSTLVEADEQVVVDRTMSWTDAGYGSHAERGTLTRTATTWYLAEGATHGNFSLFYLIQNAGTSTAIVDVKFLLPSGEPIVKRYEIPGDTRFNVNVDEIPELAEAEMSAIITSVNGVPIVVERAMYLNTPDQAFAAGHGSAGVTAPATRWFLAEGATGPFFDMFILIGNPTNDVATVEAKYQLIGGGIVTRNYEVAPNSRFNIMVDNEGDELANAAVSTTLTSTNNVPIIVERTMWFPGPTPAQWREAHNSFAETQTGTRWAVAEGEQGGPRNAETYILIANTSDFAGQALVRLLFEDGSTAERLYDMNPNSRTNAQIGVDFPEAAGKRFGAVIYSLGGTPAQIVVERAMYTSPNGQTWTAGTNAVATKLQ
jgi:uncharacterized repeat protein (TIGR01451 family)